MLWNQSNEELLCKFSPIKQTNLLKMSFIKKKWHNTKISITTVEQPNQKIKYKNIPRNCNQNINKKTREHKNTFHDKEYKMFIYTPKARVFCTSNIYRDIANSSCERHFQRDINSLWLASDVGIKKMRECVCVWYVLMFPRNFYSLFFL